jgi:hypothetical protein
MIQIAHMDCAKDRYDLLETTIIPKLNEYVRTMQTSSVIVVHDKTNLEHQKSYLVRNTIAALVVMNNLKWMWAFFVKIVATGISVPRKSYRSGTASTWEI